MKQLQNLDKISIIQVKEYYINCVHLRNIVTYLKYEIGLTVSTSASLPMSTELLCACDSVKGYPLLSTISSQLSLRHPIDPGTLFPSLCCPDGISLPVLHLMPLNFVGSDQDGSAGSVTSSSCYI
jgi:hypothetical protein